MNADDLPTPEELAELLPQYRFEELLAEGGMGAVYRAEQISLGRHVAIKILPRSLSADETYREQFKTEARLMGSLTYPHIVDIHDFGQAGGFLYIIMELLEGTNLYQRMRQEPLKQQEVVKILSQVCDALTAAHHKGVVHRDIKPENIFIEPGMRVKLGDFGISRMRRTDVDEATDASVSGVRLGTPEYAAPELFDLQKHIDHRADIFSLGVVLYEMLTGVRPTGTFVAPSHRRPGVDKRFDDVVIRAMQHEPQDRYAGAEEMKKDLFKVLQTNVQPARAVTGGKTPTGQRGSRPVPASPPQSAAKPNGETPRPGPVASGKGRRTGILIGIAAAVVAGVVVAIVAASGNKGTKKETTGADPKPEAQPPEPNETSSLVNKPWGPVPSAVPDEPQSAPREPGPPGEKLVFGGHTYQLIPGRLSWQEAKNEAERRKGHLACITSQEEYDALRSYLLPLIRIENDSCWLGASDVETEGTWKWITGEPFEFKIWASDAPNNGGDARGEQNFLAWQNQSKYGDRLIEWNDLNAHISRDTMGGMLIEWDTGAATATAPEIPSTPPSAPANPAVQNGWRPLTWTDRDLGKTSGRVELKEGWYVFSGPASLDAPRDTVTSDLAVRARIRIDTDARSFQLKPRYAKEETLICAANAPGSLRVVRRENGVPNVLADWPLADRLQTGDEVKIEMRLKGNKVTMLFNGVVAGSVDTGEASPQKSLRIFADRVAVRDVEWIPLEGAGDPDKTIAAAKSAWPVNAEISAAVNGFAAKKDAAYGAKLAASLKVLREKYTGRLGVLAAEKPADAGVFNSEAAMLAAGGDPPPVDAPDTPAVLAQVRRIYHEAKAGHEKPLATAALAVWREYQATLKALEGALRSARKLADAAEAARLRAAAELEIERFAALVPSGSKPVSPTIPGGTFPLKRPAVPGKVAVWRRALEVTQDMGVGEVPAGLGPVVAIAAGPEFGLALRPDGTVVQWGTAFAKQIEPPAGLTDVVAIDAGWKFAAALRADGSVVAWGFEHRGNLVPSGLKPAVAIACGQFQGHALHGDGTVSYFGWPSNSYPQSFATPAELSGIKALDAGRDVTMLLKNDGTLGFLGSNQETQITGVPARLKPVTLIACGLGDCCALAGGDTLYFWGRATMAKDADFARGSIKFSAVQIVASPFSDLIAARNATGEWKFFGHTESVDLKTAARNAKGAIDVKIGKEHILALMPEGKR